MKDKLKEALDLVKIYIAVENVDYIISNLELDTVNKYNNFILELITTINSSDITKYPQYKAETINKLKELYVNN